MIKCIMLKEKVKDGGIELDEGLEKKLGKDWKDKWEIKGDARISSFDKKTNEAIVKLFLESKIEHGKDNAK